MNIDKSEKKLREVEFFLRKMTDQEGLAFGDKEPFDFYLSAFLSAADSVVDRLMREQPLTFPDWRKTWLNGLSADEAEVLKFMRCDRNQETHQTGSKRSLKTEEHAILGNAYSEPGMNVQIIAAPGTGAVICKPSYSFTVAGTERKVTDVCRQCLKLLQRMVMEFKDGNP
jgi:hypothetical protein